MKRYEPHRLDAGARTTKPAPRGFDARTSKRVASAATATSDVYRNVDGSYSRRVHQGPVNYQAPDGTSRPIDSRLRVGPDGRPTVTANSFGLSFADASATAADDSPPAVPPAGATSDGTAATDGELVRLMIDPGVELAYSLAGASIGRPAVEGQVASYKSVFPNVDLELGAVATGAKEILRLHSAEAPTEYVYPLRLTGLTARLAKDGAVEFVNGNGRVAVSMPPGFMEDSVSGGAPAVSHGVRYELVSGDGGPALKMSIDGGWLRDPARRFPVIVDPTARVVTLSNDTYVQSYPTPEPDRYAYSYLGVGTPDGGVSKAKALLPFSTFDTSYAGKRFTAANLHLFMSYQGVGTGCGLRAVKVHQVTSSWAAASVTYDDFPSYSAMIGTADTSSTVACGNTDRVRNVGTWFDVPLNVAAVNDWVTGAGNYGLALTASESDSKAWKEFTSADTALACAYGTETISCDPFIDVTYADNVAPQVDTRYPPNNAVLHTLTPELTAQVEDRHGEERRRHHHVGLDHLRL